MNHTLDIEKVGATVWGYCSCGDWSARSCANETEARREHAEHRRGVRLNRDLETPVGFPAWDDYSDDEF